MFSPHFVFTADEHNFKQKILKNYRTVKILIQLDCGNTV